MGQRENLTSGWNFRREQPVLNTQRAILVRAVLAGAECAFLPGTGQSAERVDAPAGESDVNPITTHG